MAERALQLTSAIYDWILSHGAPPTSAELAGVVDSSASAVRDELRALKVGKTVLIDPASSEIWMAGPFSARPTPYEIIGRAHRWFANCAWDMLGVAHLVNEPVELRASCTDCGEPMHGRADGDTLELDGVVHFLLPARDWYTDIGFT